MGRVMARVRLVLDLCRPPPPRVLEEAARVAAALGAAVELALLLEEALLRLAALPVAQELAWPSGRVLPLGPERLERLAAARERALRRAALELEGRYGAAVALLRLEAAWRGAGRGLGPADLLLLHRGALPEEAPRERLEEALQEAVRGSPAPVLLLAGGLPEGALAALPRALRGGAPPFGPLRVRRGAAASWAEAPLLLLPPG